MFPYRDENPSLRPAVVTGVIMALNLVSWMVVQGAGSGAPLLASICRFGLIPAELFGRVEAGAAVPLAEGVACVVGEGAAWQTAFTSMFMHGSWFHLLGNLWFLWVFGNNVEDAMGHGRFAAFYLLTGLAAGAAQALPNVGSLIPMVGASGAISGVMGAYLVLYPRVRVHTLVFLGFYLRTIALPAWVMLVYWVALQALGSVPALVGAEGGGVAFLAHLGGFAAGAALILPFARRDYVEAHRRLRRPGRA
jgi:membrane associated rhomboid family serine protease